MAEPRTPEAYSQWLAEAQASEFNLTTLATTFISEVMGGRGGWTSFTNLDQLIESFETAFGEDDSNDLIDNLVTQGMFPAL